MTAQYGEPVMDLIKRRKSWRSYSEESISAEQIRRIHTFIESLQLPPFGTELRFTLSEAALPDKKRMPGTYGVIKGARQILVGAMKPSPMDFEDFGYSFESLILFCTQLGLGTCWMGGSLNRSYFGALIGLKPDEVIPAVSPVGYPLPARTIIDSFFAFTAGSKNRKPFHERFFSKDFSSPVDKNLSGEYREALEMVRLAPSAMNKQPWRVILKDGCFHFFLKRTPGYRKIYSGMDLQRIDMGIAMFHFESTARHFNLSGGWKRMEADHGVSCPADIEYRVSWVM